MNPLEPFFALVRAGLWNTESDPVLFAALSPAAWQALFSLARRQALIGICFDGVCRLPETVRPPRPLYLQWAALTLQIEQNNRRLNEAIADLFPRYRAAGLHPVLLKGQGNARLYARPLHRQSGDIDIYLGRADALTANRLLVQAGAVKEGEESEKHTSYSWQGVHIENHRIALTMSSPRANRTLQRWWAAWYPSQTLADEQAGIEAPVPPPTVNALYIFLHAFLHFLNSGVGLRQVCDWACLLSRQAEQIDGHLLVRQLTALRMLKAAQAFGYVAVHHLGLSAQLLPFSVEGEQVRRLGEALIDDILQAGNFGQYDTRVSQRPAGYWAGKWHTFTRACSRCRALYRFAPAETMWYPFRLVLHSASVQWRRFFPS